MNLNDVKVGDELIVFGAGASRRVTVTKINMRDVATTRGRYMKHNGHPHGGNDYSREHACPVNDDTIERELRANTTARGYALVKKMRELTVMPPERMTPEQVEAFNKWLTNCPVRYGA